MRLFIVFFLSCVLMSCQDKKTNDTTVTPKKSVITSIPKEPIAEVKKSDFLLTDTNVMDFFLDYDKAHKENTVRITTDFGAIDILLFEATKFHRSNFIYLIKKQ